MDEKKKAAMSVVLLFKAIKRFYMEDYNEFFALRLDGIWRMERACVFRIGSYFRELIEEEKEYKDIFNGYKIDVEYNKQGRVGNPKKILKNNICPKRIIPDLILHKRGEPDNILVCEFKTKTSQNENNCEDCYKLKSLTKQNNDKNKKITDGYKIGVFICLQQPITKHLFCNGEKIEKDFFYKEYGLFEKVEHEIELIENVDKIDR